MRLQRLRGASLAALACVALTACATTGENGSNGDPSADNGDEARQSLARGLDVADVPDPFPSTYRGLPRENMAIVGGTVFTGAGQRIDNGVVIVTDGRVAAVGGRGRVVAGGGAAGQDESARKDAGEGGEAGAPQAVDDHRTLP